MHLKSHYFGQQIAWQNLHKRTHTDTQTQTFTTLEITCIWLRGVTTITCFQTLDVKNVHYHGSLDRVTMKSY